MSYSAAGNSFEIHEWRGSGPPALHADRSPENQHEIYHRFGSELLE
jgi:hypothetical protein